MNAETRTLRVVVADDDPFTVSLVAGGLQAQGFEVFTASTIEEAWALVESEEPHALVSDLDFGHGESGTVLLQRVDHEFPWIGLVVLTSHRSPQLAVGDAEGIPASAVYIVKSTLKRVDELADGVREAIAGHPHIERVDEGTDEFTAVLTPAQAEVLRMLAAGASTRALAEHRGTTVRAAETMLTRLYAALGLTTDERSNPRVEAVHLWQQGKVTVR